MKNKKDLHGMMGLAALCTTVLSPVAVWPVLGFICKLVRDRISLTIYFDDIISQVVRHLKTNDKFRQLLQESYRYVMVDEYQDVLACSLNHVCVKVMVWP